MSTKKETKTPAALSPDWLCVPATLYTGHCAFLPPLSDNLHDLCSPQHGEKLHQALEQGSTSRFLIVCAVLSLGLGLGLGCGMEIRWSALLPHGPAS